MTDHSPAPGTPQSATKAVVGAVLGFVASFASFWIADADPFTQGEIVQGLLAAAVAAGLTGGTVLGVKNTPK